jgi:hypothetical protein
MSSDNAQSLIINATEFNPSKQIKYSKMKVNKAGGKSVGILNSETGKSLILQTPMILTWGANKFVDEKNGKETYDMALQFPRDDYQTEDNRKFLDAMIAFQKKLKEDAITNSKEWFNKPKMSTEVLDALFHPMLTYAKDKETGEPDMTKAPTLKVKIPVWDGAYNCEVYDTNQQMLFPSDSSGVTPLDLITKASTIIAVIQCGGFWFANGKLGVTWKLIQCVVKPKPTLKGRCLINLSTDAKTLIEKSSAPIQSARAEEEDDDDEDDNEGGGGGNVNNTMKVVEDSDNEEDAATESSSSLLQQPPVSAAAVAAVEEIVKPLAAAPIKKEIKRVVKKKE